MTIVAQNNKPLATSSNESITQLMHVVLQKAQKYGATDAVVTVNNDCGFSVDVRMRAVDTVAFNEDRNISVTLYLGKSMGSASSSDISDTALDAMVHAAYDIAKVSADDPCFGLPDIELVQHSYPNLDLQHAWDISPTDAIKLALECEAQALALDKRIVNSDGVNVATYVGKEGYASTQGFLGIIDSSRHSISCSLLAQDVKGMQRDYDYTTARKVSELLSIEELASRTVERTTSRLNPRRLITQRAPVIFASRLSSGLFSAFVSAISGGMLYRKQSFLCDALGKQLFPEYVRIYEQPHLLGGLGSSPFDGEGLITRANVLVDAGILKQYVLNSYAARKLGLQTTANSGGVFNLTIDPTTGDLTDILKQMDTGLLVTELMGQGVNGLTGDYSRGASGFWVQGGEIQYPVEELTIAGNLKDMFQRIIALGNDLNPNSATRVGSVLIDDMMVAGT